VAQLSPGSALVEATPAGWRRREPGRGAYLHRDAACLERAIKRKAIRRAFRMAPAIQAELGASVHALAGEQGTNNATTGTPARGQRELEG
jgi:predicted RNA-binding protein YlxR (DUF448 family)